MMHTLSDVRQALDKGDRARAVELLKPLLQAEPSAEAWYLAAKLSNDREKIVQYLQYSLIYDDDYYPARRMLERMGESPKTYVDHLLETVEQRVTGEFERTPILRVLPPRTQLITVVGIVVALVLAFIFVIRMTFAGSAAPAAAQQPAEVVVHSVSAVRSHLANSDLGVVSIAEMERRSNRTSLRLVLGEGENSSQFADVWVYESIPALVNDRETLESYSQSRRVESYGNVVLFYPRSLPSAQADLLKQVFETLTR